MTRRRGVEERGSASVELVILFPALLLIVTALIQYSLWFHARSIALAAAQQGVSAARAYHSDPRLGRETALAFVADHGAGTLLYASATASSPVARHIEVVVTGRSLTVIPGAPGLAVSESASAPIERFTTAGTP